VTENIQKSLVQTDKPDDIKQ